MKYVLLLCLSVILCFPALGLIGPDFNVETFWRNYLIITQVTTLTSKNEIEKEWKRGELMQTTSSEQMKM